MATCCGLQSCTVTCSCFPEKMKESWSTPGDPEVLRGAFEGWDPRVGEVLKEVEKTFR